MVPKNLAWHITALCCLKDKKNHVRASIWYKCIQKMHICRYLSHRIYNVTHSPKISNRFAKRNGLLDRPMGNKIRQFRIVLIIYSLQFRYLPSFWYILYIVKLYTDSQNIYLPNLTPVCFVLLSLPRLQMYPKLMKAFMTDDHDHSVCVVSETVQFFTVPTLVGWPKHPWSRVTFTVLAFMCLFFMQRTTQW